MEGTSVRKGLSGLSRSEQIDELRARMRSVTGGGSDIIPDVAGGEGLDVGLPWPLPRRAVTEVSDCPAVVVEFIRQVTAAGGYVGVVGWPDLSYAGIEHLDHVVAVPSPGQDPLGIASVLVEGLDLVVFYSPVEMNLSPVRIRPLQGRLRAGAAALVLVGWRAPSPALRVTAAVSTYRGIGRGTGRITGYDIDVRLADKANQLRTTWTVGEKPVLRVVR